MRRLIVSLVVLVGLLVAVDRVGLVLAERDVAQRIQSDQHLSATPDVTIHGFPFLTQLFGGTYDDVDVTVHGLHAGVIQVARVTAHLHCAHVSFGDVITQHVSRIRIHRAQAQVVLEFAGLREIARQLGSRAADGFTAKTVTGVDVTGGTTVTLHTSFGINVPLPLPGLPFDIHFDSAKLTQTGLVITGSATGLVVRT